MLDFLGSRIFGPDRLRFLRAELAKATAASWKDHDAELERLQREQRDVQRSLYRQTLRLEEHDDPDHPIVALATCRIEAGRPPRSRRGGHRHAACQATRGRPPR